MHPKELPGVDAGISNPAFPDFLSIYAGIDREDTIQFLSYEVHDGKIVPGCQIRRLAKG
jgi:hypothetical protein